MEQIEYENRQSERVPTLYSLINHENSAQYRHEEGTTEAIKKGDMDQLNDVLQQSTIEELMNEGDPIDSGYSLRDSKDFLRSINTHCRMAAKNGDVSGLYLHLISERYQSTIDNLENEDDVIKNVFYSMYKEYCQAVQNFSAATYSPTMKEIASYITEHLTSSLTLKETAQKWGMHPVHLARTFKQKTGTTFIDYINQQRIDLAKYYLRVENHPLSETAYLSGFNSHSYFTKVFKKVTGETPNKYIKNQLA